MDIVHLLDEWLLLLWAGVWLEFHATPLAGVLATALVLATLLAVREIRAVAYTVGCAPVHAIARSPRHSAAESDSRVAIPLAAMTHGARGPRAPGRRMPRLVPAR